MANYYATTRSNHFRVTNAEAFLAWCKALNLDHWTKEYPAHPDDTFYAISADSRGDCDGWPTYHENENGDEDEDFDFHAALASHLDPRDVAILQEIGNEKLRYLCGIATAINAEGKSVYVSLRHIDDLAEKTFPGLNITDTAY